MSDWYANPLVWIGLLSLSAVAFGLVFGLGQWKGKVDSDRASFKEFMTGIKGDLAEIRSNINRIFERLPSPRPLASGSPLRLTELGRKISARLDAGTIADSLLPQLRERSSGLQPYEIQELCFAHVREKYEPPEDVEALVLQCAFDDGLDREQVLDVIAIELRDRLLPRQEE